jgi:hypothetical protein
MLRRIFGSERAEVTGGWRKLLNEEVNNLYFTLQQILLRMRWAKHVVHMGNDKSTKNLGRKA